MREPAAQYLRLSSGVQINALPDQIEVISDYAARNGFVVVRTYQDIGRSGVSQSRREGLAELLRDIQGEVPFRTLLVRDVTRWGRFQNPDEAAYLEFMCRLAGIEVRYCAEAFQEAGALAGSIQKHIKRVMAAEYSRQLSDRCRAGLRRAALAGCSTGSRAPYGFARRPVGSDGELEETLKPGERPLQPGQPVRLGPGAAHEVATVRRIFNLFVNQIFSASEISNILNGDEISYRGGLEWTRARVLYVLNNELAIGIHCFNKRVTRFSKVQYINSASDWIRVQVFDPLVDPALFRAAAAKQKASKYKHFSNVELIAKLRRLHRKHGQITRSIIEAEPDTPRPLTYIRRFGSLRTAYRLAGYHDTKRRRCRRSIHASGDAEILRLLKALHKEKGRLTAKIIDAAPDLPSARSIAEHFGGLRAAYAMIDVKQSWQHRQGVS